MKSGIHPSYRKVLFVDASSGDEWVSYSTMTGSDTRPHKGEDLPVVRVDISSFSHPFWTGQSREVDTEGRMDRFRRRYNVKGGAAAAAPAPAAAKPVAAAPAPAKAEAAAPAKPAAKAKKK
ncbi:MULTISPECIES: type B 50S ribosomal protein L31 [Nannocystis]|uniref:50S ribosomal protein L31 n=1 Tax=Nannocystis radixulma TaxID=2995305 RepID=A0ABT5BEA4_9BACT|nr:MULTISPECIES: type B 50S ribosomal protein L31 [Nannocystis]MCY1058295.1 type B 50S ribosomal protein L31 [Nannocystis sp. SCPEA4]MDC0671834.1 type B 50S ribosomal protein L31 [Nannocystis radixulma]